MRNIKVKFKNTIYKDVLPNFSLDDLVMIIEYKTGLRVDKIEEIIQIEKEVEE